MEITSLSGPPTWTFLLGKKIIELKHRIEQDQDPPHIVAISEVKPKYHKRNIDIIEYQLEGYYIEHKNITMDSIGRGLVMYIKEPLSGNVYEPTTKFEETLVINLKLNNNEALTLALLYRSPNSTDSNNNHLNKLIDELCANNSTRIMLVGDLNFPGIDWSAVTTTTRVEGREFHFIEKIRDNFLTQHVMEPTRCRGSDNPSTLDLVLTNDDNRVEALDVGAPIGKSDHAVIKVQVQLACEQPSEQQPEHYNYDKGNYDGLRAALEIDWTSELAPYGNVQDKWKFFRDKYEEAVEANIPKVIPRNRKTYKIPLDRETLKKIRAKVNKKDKLWKKKLREKTRDAEIEYNRVRNQVRSLTRKAERIYEKNIISKIKENPKKFWMYVRRKSKNRPGIPELEMDGAAGLTTGNAQKAEVLSEYFTSVFTREPEGDPSHMPDVCQSKLANCYVDADLVKKRLKKIKTAKSPGPDQIHPRVLKELHNVLHIPLAVIISSSLDTGELPTDWKHAHISAIFKKGSKKKAENYCPVSLTSVIVKIAESIIRDATHVWGKNRKTGNKYSCHQLPFPSYPNLFRPTSPQLSLIATNGA